jgi:RNA polymerase-binding transcription factor DksA
MATKKKAAKPAAKKATKPAVKKAAKPVKKVSPAKKTAAVKKAAVKKPMAKSKPASKPVAKKSVKNAKPVTKKAVATKKTGTKVVVKKSLSKPTKKPMVKKSTDKKVAVAVVQSKTFATSAKTSSKNINSKVSPASLKPKEIKVAAAKPVVLPTINTKTSRKYQPDFTKSVLDQPINDPGAPIIRYSDLDLNEFRDLIQRKLDSAKKELTYLQGLITRKDEMGGDEGDNRYMTMEDGSLSMDREQLSQMASRQITFIDHLEKALMRIENKTYGVCRITGKLIDKARLRAVPHATLSIEAKMGAGK